MNAKRFEDEITVAELRTAAKVLRHVHSEVREDLDRMNWFARWWWQLWREDVDETLRKAALLDRIADRIETIKRKEKV